MTVITQLLGVPREDEPRFHAWTEEVADTVTMLVRRLESPRLLQVPPPYRRKSNLRGPLRVRVGIDGVRD